MRRLLTGLAALALCTARPAVAQTVTFQLGGASDTAIGAVPGVETAVRVRALNDYGYYYYPLTKASVVFRFDPSKIEVLGVDTVAYGFASPEGSSAGPGAYRVNANGWVAQEDLYRLRLRLLAGTTDGTYLWIEPDSTQLTYLYGGTIDALGQSSAAQLCHASNIWGDVDENGRVDSRDALITLSAAVGLPVTGFDLSIGDTDADGLTNSRDALVMLSHSIGLPVYFAEVRVAVAIPDACAPLEAPGERLAFHVTGQGLFLLDATSTTPVRITSVATDQAPQLDPSGTRIAFTSQDSLGYDQLYLVNADGSGRTRLTGPGSPGSRLPDWSPDGDHLVYLQSGGIVYRVVSLWWDSVSAFPSGTPYWVAFGRDGRRIAYTGSGGVGVLDSITGTTTTVSSDTYGDGVRWSVDGDTVWYLRSDYRLFSVPATGGTPRMRLPFVGTTRGFDLGPAGLVFSNPMGRTTASLWRMDPGGVLRRLTPETLGEAARPSYRRSP